MIEYIGKKEPIKYIEELYNEMLKNEDYNYMFEITEYRKNGELQTMNIDITSKNARLEF